MSVNPTMAVSKDVVWREGMTLERMRNEKPRGSRVPLLRNEEVVEYPCDQATLTRRYTEEGVKFIRANRDRPFFLYLPHTMPHVPLFASEEFKGTSARGLYGDVIEEIDASVGRILETLRELELDKRTLVLFTADNGPWLAKKKHGGCALPLRDGKFTTWEGGMREPCIMWWPGQIPAGTTCSEVAATIDVLPTFARLAGAKTPDDRIIDGKDIWPLICGQPGAKSPHAAYFFRNSAVRSGKWKLHLSGRDTVRKRPEQVFPALYDLSTDVAEDHNVAAEHPHVVERLTKLIREHRAEIAAHKRPVGEMKAGKGR